MSVSDKIKDRLNLILTIDKFDKKDKLSNAFKDDLIKVFSSYFKIDGGLNLEIKVKDGKYFINVFGQASDVYHY